MRHIFDDASNTDKWFKLVGNSYIIKSRPSMSPTHDHPQLLVAFARGQHVLVSRCPGVYVVVLLKGGRGKSSLEQASAWLMQLARKIAPR